MSKFIVTRNSYFEPLSYDEIVKPLAELQTQHNAAQEAYDKMAMDTAALENYISKEGKDDAKAREMYNNYKTKLQTLQDNLWANGINAQTRRDLSAARNAYASDITRLAKAVETRQARSKEYWEARHKDPSLITGADPGLAGLDNYLDDDLYGQNYYSYSGKQFASEVAADAQARASEMLNNPEIYKDPNLPGYLLEKSREGYTSQEVQNASYAVRAALEGDASLLSKLNPAEKILADVLTTHLESTGASGKIDSDQFGRLFNYGVEGLSQAIGKTSVNRINDKVWDINADIEKQKRIYDINHPQVTPTSDTGYTINNTITEKESPDYEVLSKEIGRKAKKYESSPLTVKRPDGTSITFNDIFEASEEIYNPEIRKKTRARMNGLDVGLSTGIKQTAVFMDENGNKVTVHTRKIPDAIAKRMGLKYGGVYVEDENGVLDEQVTKDFNIARIQYNEYLENYKKNNPGIKFREDYAISPDEEYKLRQENKISPTTDSRNVGAIVMGRNRRGVYSDAVLADESQGMQYAREDFGRKLVSTFNSVSATQDIGKGSRYAFYKVGNGGESVSKEGVTDIKKVLGDPVDTKNIYSVSVTPESIYNSNDGRQTVRLNTSTGLWDVDASMFGDLVYTALSPNIRASVKDMMTPIMNPEYILNLPNSEADKYTVAIANMLGLSQMYKVKDIARDTAKQDWLRNQIVQFLNKRLSIARDTVDKNHNQNVGNSSSKAPYYIQNQ